MSPISSMCHQTGLVAPQGDAQGIDASGPAGDTLPWEGKVSTPAQTPQVPLAAPQPRHRPQHRVPRSSRSTRKTNKFPFPPQPKFPWSHQHPVETLPASSNILTCRQARPAPASPLINTSTIITVITDSDQQHWDQYPLLYDGFLHPRQSARGGNGSGRHWQHSPLPNLAGGQQLFRLLGFFCSFCSGVIMGLGERDHLPCFPPCNCAVST